MRLAGDDRGVAHLAALQPVESRGDELQRGMDWESVSDGLCKTIRRCCHARENDTVRACLTLLLAAPSAAGAAPASWTCAIKAPVRSECGPGGRRARVACGRRAHLAADEVYCLDAPIEI